MYSASLCVVQPLLEDLHEVTKEWQAYLKLQSYTSCCAGYTYRATTNIISGSRRHSGNNTQRSRSWCDQRAHRDCRTIRHHQGCMDPRNHGGWQCCSRYHLQRWHLQSCAMHQHVAVLYFGKSGLVCHGMTARRCRAQH